MNYREKVVDCRDQKISRARDIQRVKQSLKRGSIEVEGRFNLAGC